MEVVSLHQLIASYIAKEQSDDPPVQVVVHPNNLARLLEESGDEHPFERDGTGGYIAFGLPVYLDVECPGAAIMGVEQRELWEKDRLGRIPFGRLSLR